MLHACSHSLDSNQYYTQPVLKQTDSKERWKSKTAKRLQLILFDKCSLIYWNKIYVGCLCSTAATSARGMGSPYQGGVAVVGGGLPAFSQSTGNGSSLQQWQLAALLGYESHLVQLFNTTGDKCGKA